MKKLILLLLFIPLVCLGQDCPPCEIIANEGMKITESDWDWPKLNNGEIYRLNSLTNIKYTGDEKYWGWWNKRKSWWLKDKSDPWSLTTDWVNNYEEPNHSFKECVDDKLRWMCGYSFNIKLPENFKINKRYPLLIFLHGGVIESSSSLTRKIRNLSNFYMSPKDEYVIAAPIKLGIDWSPKRIQDMIENIKSNIKIDEDRIYLTGLSMGGRGTFIVAAELPNLFAAIMPLSPHHTPYSYLSLANEFSNLPIFLHHSINDKTSKFSTAEKMSVELKKINDNVIFDVGEFGHSGWNKIYKNPKNINWLLSWKKNR